MELCSLEDAFPKIDKQTIQGGGSDSSRSDPVVGCTTSYSSREERRAARKKAKRCKGPALAYSDQQEGADAVQDADRTAWKRLGEVPAFVSYEDAFKDVSGITLPKVQVGPGAGDATVIEKFKLPILPNQNCLIADKGLPAYFGAGLDDLEEDFQNYGSSSVSGTVPGDRLVPPTLDRSFEGTGVGKASAAPSQALPAPFLDDAWKPLTPAKVRTAFFPAGATVVAEPPPAQPLVSPATARSGQEIRAAVDAAAAASLQTPRRDTELLERIAELTRRLEELEHKNSRSSQNEILLFVGSGILILAALEFGIHLGIKR